MFMASLIGDLPPIRHAGDVHNWNVSYRSQSLITLGYSRYHAGIQPPHVFQSMSTNRTSAIMTCTPVLGSAVFQAACFIFHDTNGGPKSRSIVCTGRCLHNFPSLTWSICYFVVSFGQNISNIVEGLSMRGMAETEVREKEWRGRWDVGGDVVDGGVQ